MLARQRQEHILERVAATGGVRVADVVEELGISEMTVRRDITELVTQGLVERVHGGAVAAGPTTLEPRFTAKSTLNLEAKRRIGQAAAAMVRPGDSLALSAGTTTLALAQALTELEHFPTLTVITNSLPAAQVLFDAADAARAENRDAPTVVITGGERTPSNALVGLVAVDALRTMRVEWVFLGAHGFTPEAGLMTPNLQEASANQALVAAGRTVVATLDSSKCEVVPVGGHVRGRQCDPPPRPRGVNARRHCCPSFAHFQATVLTGASKSSSSSSSARMRVTDTPGISRLVT